MMMPMPIDMAPTITARARFFSSTISFQRAYGVILSITTKAMTKIRMPRAANIAALISAFRCVSIGVILLFTAHVAWVGSVVRAPGARVVANRLGDVLQFVGQDVAHSIPLHA